MTGWKPLGVMRPRAEGRGGVPHHVPLGETVVIETRAEWYTGTRIAFSYAVRDKATGALRCQGRTEHCFINEKGRPVSLKKACPAYHQTVEAAVSGG